MANVMREVLSVKRRMYTPNEVALHNCAEDIWLSVFGRVYDLTNFVRDNEGERANGIAVTMRLLRTHISFFRFCFCFGCCCVWCFDLRVSCACFSVLCGFVFGRPARCANG